ncbi:MAG TPA: hypothetical protein VKM94_26200 [Blastocatellia bacterium]|nr:hypothetical protein [Blastocatellia bacterium]
MSSAIPIIGLLGFVLGILPLAALAFFSPGLGSEKSWGVAVFAAGVATLILLLLSARKRPLFWVFAVVQGLMLAAVLFETFSDGRLYIGT